MRVKFQSRDEAYRHLQEHQQVGQGDKDYTSALRMLEVLLADRGDLGAVLDVGCGRGAWLKAAHQLGADEVVGIEGPWLNRDNLMIDQSCVRVVDLDTGVFDLGRRFHTAICIEVGEHLVPEAADALVKSLCDHAPRVVFSAAIPGQGGHGHINEQFLPYWEEKFAKYGYGRREIFRKALWGDTEIHYYLRQNVVLFEKYATTDAMPASVVHPEMWSVVSERYRDVMEALIAAGHVEETTGPDGLAHIVVRIPEPKNKWR